MRGIRCSSRGWAKAAKGASRQFASRASRSGGRRLDGGGEPGVEGAGAIGGLEAEVAAEIMEAHAAGDDKHAFIAQRSEGAAGSDVQRRIE